MNIQLVDVSSTDTEANIHVGDNHYWFEFSSIEYLNTRRPEYDVKHHRSISFGIKTRHGYYRTDKTGLNTDHFQVISALLGVLKLYLAKHPQIKYISYLASLDRLPAYRRIFRRAGLKLIDSVDDVYSLHRVQDLYTRA